MTRGSVEKAVGRQSVRGSKKGPSGAGIIWIGLLLGGMLDLLGGCGKVGAPLAPEKIGVAAKLERERRELQAAEPGAVPQKEAEPEQAPQEEITLPPLRPIRSR